MDAPRFDEMSDAALDRDLQALLAADPSPAFVAGVRAQIAANAATSRTGFAAWGLPLAVAATIALVIVTLAGYRGGRRLIIGDRPAALATRPLAHSNTTASVGSLVVDLKRSVSDRLPPRSTPIVAAPQAVASAEPEVLVDPREAAALRAFFARARSGDVELAAIMAPPSTPQADSNDLHNIYIAPIAFEPVIGAAEDKGVRQ
jgi:hypothetical protein